MLTGSGRLMAGRRNQEATGVTTLLVGAAELRPTHQCLTRQQNV